MAADAAAPGKTPSFEAPLSAAAMEGILGAVMAGTMPADEVARFLSTLAKRGETAEELAAAVGVLRRHAVTLPIAPGLEVGDTCGTGGDNLATVNVSTMAALTAAAGGALIVKHGNRAASSRCGSADVLEALGVSLDATPAQVAKSVADLGFGFCFAPKFHPAMKAVAPVRKALGIRTIFNLIGPLANPARLTFQLIGVSEPRLLRPMAEALGRLGVRHAMVVRGADGMDEATTTGPTDFLEVRGAEVSGGRLEPEAVGLKRAAPDALRGGDAAHNARLAREVLGGAPSAARDLVALNAGCVLYVAGRAPGIREGVAQALRLLQAGAPLALLERVKEYSHAG
jgi:anthranilate phosphoribosyltransferase